MSGKAVLVLLLVTTYGCGRATLEVLAAAEKLGSREPPRRAHHWSTLTVKGLSLGERERAEALFAEMSRSLGYSCGGSGWVHWQLSCHQATASSQTSLQFCATNDCVAVYVYADVPWGRKPPKSYSKHRTVLLDALAGSFMDQGVHVYSGDLAGNARANMPPCAE